MNDCLTPPVLARRLGVDVHKILSWITSGELTAINCATRPAGRPRWRITEEAVAEFARRRSSAPAPRQPRRRRQPMTEAREWIR